ncbi:MAG TPA: lysozyme [Bacteroidia bacterium]|nr:lysozyme [Bacteroidia bacterium]
MAKVTNVSRNCIDLITHFEGLFLNSYLCPANVWTIGYGTTIYPDGKKVSADEACTQLQAMIFFRNDLGYFEKMVDAYTRDDVSQQQFDALVSFAYNLGAKSLKDSTLLKVINSNPLSFELIFTQWLRWNKANGAPLKGLTRRRNSEFHYYKTGELKFDF